MATVDEKLDSLLHSLQRVSVKLEQISVSLRSITEKSADHEERIRVIERWHNKMSPVLALLTFILGAAFKATMDRLM